MFPAWITTTTTTVANGSIAKERPHVHVIESIGVKPLPYFVELL